MTKFLNKSSFKLSLTLVCLFFSQIVLGESDVDLVEIKLINNLDDERGFCIDIKGYKDKAKINRGLQAHTCYSYQGEIAVDQGLDSNKFSYNQLFFPNFNTCINASSLNKEMYLNLVECIDEKQFIFFKDNTIRLISDLNLCMTVNNRESKKGGGGSPLHLIRSLSIQKCNKNNFLYQTWVLRRVVKGKIIQDELINYIQ